MALTLAPPPPQSPLTSPTQLLPHIIYPTTLVEYPALPLPLLQHQMKNNVSAFSETQRRHSSRGTRRREMAQRASGSYLGEG